jgi:hypothetical protein
MSLACRAAGAYSRAIDTTNTPQEPTMTKTFAAQAASLAAAALLTVATFAATASIAGHTYRAASVTQLQSQPTTVAAVQHVTVVGHRGMRA